MAFLTGNNQINSNPTTHFVTTCLTQSFHCPSSPMPHVTPPGFEPGPPAPLACILTTRLWLTCKSRCSKKFIHDIPMVRVSSSIFKIISLILNHDTTKV